MNIRNPFLPRLPSQSKGGRYEIVVEARLGRRWAESFAGFELVERDDGTTHLEGEVIDQAALHSAFTRLRDMGVAIVSVMRLDDGPGEAHRQR